MSTKDLQSIKAILIMTKPRDARIVVALATIDKALAIRAKQASKTFVSPEEYELCSY